VVLRGNLDFEGRTPYVSCESPPGKFQYVSLTLPCRRQKSGSTSSLFYGASWTLILTVVKDTLLAPFFECRGRCTDGYQTGILFFSFAVARRRCASPLASSVSWCRIFFLFFLFGCWTCGCWWRLWRCLLGRWWLCWRLQLSGWPVLKQQISVRLTEIVPGACEELVCFVVGKCLTALQASHHHNTEDKVMFSCRRTQFFDDPQRFLLDVVAIGIRCSPQIPPLVYLLCGRLFRQVLPKLL